MTNIFCMYDFLLADFGLSGKFQRKPANYARDIKVHNSVRMHKCTLRSLTLTIQ